ncbi:hypothetical protein S13e_00035 [Klebsiella phage VLCpiS13e]|uniref:hypothetical protein n=1 Tax=Klebsiella phage VLCpiS13e TaxID=2874889 RepID=UPI00233E8763|nr:hypothetical protein PRB82_gp35 [Klebsiella phage VLCpiS13e]UVX31621.1 hypothetical protein S13e_00035 [Klebsiella phage VLCpiS13e]
MGPAMTDITELAQSLKAAANTTADAIDRLKAFPGDELIDLSQHEGEQVDIDITTLNEWYELSSPANILALVEALEKAQQAPNMPLGLHPDTQKLVADFCTALAEKLYKAQLKYGYDTDWKQDGWPSQCQAHFHQHIAKGDPRDVAAYCAFMWWHGWSTKPAEGLESRTVTVKLPDYRSTYKGPFADEVEHQVRLALELFSSAAGIKVEAQ